MFGWKGGKNKTCTYYSLMCTIFFPPVTATRRPADVTSHVIPAHTDKKSSLQDGDALYKRHGFRKDVQNHKPLSFWKCMCDLIHVIDLFLTKSYVYHEYGIKWHNFWFATKVKNYEITQIGVKRAILLYLSFFRTSINQLHEMHFGMLLITFCFLFTFMHLAHTFIQSFKHQNKSLTVFFVY